MIAMKTIFFLVFFCQLGFQIFGDHTCQYRVPKIKNLVNGIKIDPLPPNFREKRQATSNLRISFDYQPSFSASPDVQALKENIMEPARKLLEQYLVPKMPINGLLRIDRSCDIHNYRLSMNGTRGCAVGCTVTECLGVQVPNKYLKQCVVINNDGNVVLSDVQGEGIANIDIVLLVTFIPCNGLTLAFAGSCFTENHLDRPILGVINLCADQIQSNTRVKENIKVVVHEMIHALGIAVDKYAFFRYPDGTPIVPRNNFGWPDAGLSADNTYYNWNDKIIKQFSRKRSSLYSSYSLTFYGFVLPNVLTAARNHFNCPTLEGVDIEDFGGNGSALSHFDEYFLYNELMTSQSNNDMDVLSNITLALLSDTGWYNVNFSNVEKLDYGYQKGCILPEQGCFKYMQAQTASQLNLDPFCNKPLVFGNALECSSFKNYFYFCSLGKLSHQLPIVNQYFKSIEGVDSDSIASYGGPSPYNEYCPNYVVLTDPSFMCKNELNINLTNTYNFVPSYFGQDSMCFRNELYSPNPATYYGASCQKYNMVEFPNKLTIFVNNMSFICPSDRIHTYYLSDGKQVIIRCPDDLRTLPTTNAQTSTTMTSVLSTYLFAIIIWRIISFY